MGVIYSFDATYYGRALHLRVLDNVLSNASDYLIEPIFDPLENLYDSPYTEKEVFVYEDGGVSKSCFYVDHNASSNGHLLRGVGSLSIAKYTYNVGQTTPIRSVTNITVADFPGSPSGSNYRDVNIATNVPIFDTQQEAQDYINGLSDGTNAINYGAGGSVFDDTTVEYYVNEIHNEYTVNKGIVSQAGQATYIRAERILYNGDTICLYRGDNNPFELTLLYGNDIVGSKYSNSSFNELLEVPYYDFTLGQIEYTTPFYSGYKSDLGVTDYTGFLATIFSTNIPLFSDYTNAQKYINGEIDVTQAENWKNISNDKNWSKRVKNDTGDEETQTDMGQSFAQNFFSQLYLCPTGAVNQIATALYDVGVGSLSGLWDEIKKGVEMYGDDPMQSVQGLMFFPLDLSTVYPNVQDQNYVYFGGYKLDIQTNVKKIIFQNGYKSFGNITIKKSFNNWRDYEPYTKLYIYLPYVGTFQLQLSRYYGKSTEIRYYFDLRTGTCLVALLTSDTTSSGVLTDYFNGQLGVQLPITLTDKSAYANSQVNTLLKGASSIGSVVSDIGAGIAGGASIPVTGAFGALQAGVGVAKTVYDLTQNNKTNYNKTTGGSTSMLNEFLPQYPYFIFEIQKLEETDNMQMLQGYPSNESGNVEKFSGYLEVDSLNLICATATDNEKRQITQALYNGIII